MPYKAFACPKCGVRVDPESSNFCSSCGVNLLKYDKLEKKTFYYKSEYCPKCGEPGGLKFEKRPIYQYADSQGECSYCGVKVTKSPYGGVELR